MTVSTYAKQFSGAVALSVGLAVGSFGVPSFTTVALAAGDGDSGTVTMRCSSGKVWDKKTKKCVKEEKSSSLDQDSIYEYGRDLARNDRFEEAIRVLYLAPDQGDPRVLNYLGFSHRKLGKMDEALAYYQSAIAANPDYSLVREYLGEAYLQLGELEQARGQLTEIERICGSRTCGEYKQLAELIVESQRD